MAEKKKKYEVTIISKGGECDKPLFEKMLKNGDVVAESVKEHVGEFVRFLGYAKVNIDTDDKNFDLTYYLTNIGYICTGSEVFFESVLDYIDEDEVDCFKIVEVKTRKGTTYKATPILKVNTKSNNVEIEK